jgi:hypothetical protein
VRTSFHFKPRVITLELWKVALGSVLAAPNCPALDSKSTLCVQTGVVVRGT